MVDAEALHALCCDIDVVFLLQHGLPFCPVFAKECQLALSLYRVDGDVVQYGNARLVDGEDVQLERQYKKAFASIEELTFGGIVTSVSQRWTKTNKPFGIHIQHQRTVMVGVAFPCAESIS